MTGRRRGALVGLFLLCAAYWPRPCRAAEPRRIVSVVVDAADTEVRRLARYVAIPSGTPLEPEAIRALVELIFATGQYEDVVVDSEEVPGGVRLVIRPRVAPLLAAIKVTGRSPLRRDDIRRLGGLHEREALFPADLEQAARRLEEALRARGFVAPQVDAISRRVEAGAEAIFTIAAGERLRIVTVQAPGAGALEAVAVKEARPRAGQFFDLEKARRSAENARKRLAEAGYWRATVTPPASVAEVTGGAMVFVVELGPPMALAFDGTAPPRKVQKAVLRIAREGKGREDALDEAAERLEADARRRGDRGGAIARRVEERDGATTVVFTVAPAAKARVSAVSVEGFPRPPALATRMDKPLDETALAADRLLIQQAALHAGYPQAEVAVEAKPGGGDVAVLFRVSLGPQAFFGVISIDAPTEVQPLIERHRSHLRTGDPYTIEAVAAERDDLVAALRNDGYAQAEVAPSVVPSGEGDRIDVVFAVQPGRQELVGRIVVAGLEHTREEVVRREITLVEGKPLGLDQLLESQRRLSALGLFRAIQIDETDADAQGRRNVVVRVRESTPTSVSYGAGYGERDNLRFSVEVTRKNLAGMNRTLSTFARWSFQTNRFLATYREPFLRNRRQDLFLSIFREEEERDSFSFRRYGTSAQTAFALGKTWNAIVRYSFQKTDTFRVQVPLDEVDRRFQQSTLSGPSVSFVKDTRDDALDPSSGHFIGMDNQLSLNVLGGDTFAKTFLQAAAYRRLNSRTVLAVAGRGGLGRAFGTTGLRLPLADRFFAGGDYSLRGYRLDTAGPLVLSTDGSRLLPEGGNALLLGSVELRFDLARRFSVAAFTDFGNVYPFIAAIDLGDVLVSVGTGIRYKSAIGPLRLDWGYKLDRRPQEKPYAFHVTIGHAF